MADGHMAGQKTMDQFDLILGYMIRQGRRVEPGHTMQLGEENVRFRNPAPTDPSGGSEGRVLVFDKITASAINRPAPVPEIQDLTFEEMGAIESAGKRAVMTLTTATYGSPPDAIVQAIDDELRRYQKQQKSFMSKIIKPKPVDRGAGERTWCTLGAPIGPAIWVGVGKVGTQRKEDIWCVV